MKPIEYEDSMRREIAKYPGVSLSFEHRGKHKAAVLSTEHKTLRVFYPSTPSDSGRGLLNKRQDVRRVLRQLGVAL